MSRSPVVGQYFGSLTALVSFFSPPSVGGWRVRNSPAPWLFSPSPTRCFPARLRFPPRPLLSLPRRTARRSSSACCARACALRVSSKGLLCPRPPFLPWRSGRPGLCSLRPCSPGCVGFSLFLFLSFLFPYIIRAAYSHAAPLLHDAIGKPKSRSCSSQSSVSILRTF